MTNLTERMKKYAEMVESFAPSMDGTQLNMVAYMYSDLQSTVRALEVAMVCMSEIRYKCRYETPPYRTIENNIAMAERTIDNILGSKP